MKLVLFIVFLQIPAQLIADSHSQQQFLAQQIYNLSHVVNEHHEGVDRNSSIAFSLSHPFTLKNEAYVEIEACVLTFREFGFAEGIGFFPTYEAALDLKKVQITSNRETNDPYFYVSHEELKGDARSLGGIEFRKSDGGGDSIPYRLREYTSSDFDPKLEPFELDYNDGLTRGVVVGFYNITENAIRELANAIILYKSDYCGAES